MALTASASPPAGYTLVWSDEFNQSVGSPPSLANWVYVTGNGGFGNNELETYVTDTAHAQIIADPQATDGRALQIQATWDSVHGYQSARIDTSGKFSAQYGFIEARIQLPSGQGIWPAFWMLGTNIGTVGWPACGEVDIMENIGNQSWLGRIQSTIHSPNHSGAGGLGAAYNLPAGQFFKDGYHLFQCLWSANSISFFVDGNLFETRTPADTGSSPWPFNAPFFLILDLAVGGSFPGNPDSTTVFPQNYLIDYIRVYTANTPTGAPTITTQPASVSVLAGNTATFNVTANGNPSPTFQWQRLPSGNSAWVNLSDGGSYNGSATTTLTISSTTTDMSNDQFRGVATNSAGSATSSTAALTVTVSNPPAQSSTPPSSSGGGGGGATSFWFIGALSLLAAARKFRHRRRGNPFRPGEAGQIE